MLLACGGRADEDTEEPGWGRRGHRRPPLCDRSRTRRPARSAESAVAAGSPSPPRPPLLSSEEQRQVFKDSDGNTALLGHTLELTRRQKMSRTAVRSFPRSINGAWERPGPAWALGPSSFEGGHRAGREQTRPAAWKATQLPAPGERREGSRLSRRPWPARLLVGAPGRSPGSTEAHTIGVTAALGAGTFHAGKSRLREVKTQLELYSHTLRRPAPHAAPPAPWPSGPPGRALLSPAAPGPARGWRLLSHLPGGGPAPRARPSLAEPGAAYCPLQKVLGKPGHARTGKYDYLIVS